MPKPHADQYAQRCAEHGALYRMRLTYIGTAFSGFQSQTDQNAVQDHVERALATILRHPVRIRGASRTDRGVHAQMQMASFRTKLPFSRRWILGLNALLSPDIGVLTLEPAANDFDPIYDAKAKAYRYRLWKGRCFSPYFKPFVWAVPFAFSTAELQRLAPLLVGQHDFASFCNKDSDAKTTVRRILEVKVDERGPLVDIWLCGEGFLKQMVRIIVGTLVAMAADKMPPDDLPKILAGRQRELAGPTAPALGLCLVELFYDEVPSLDSLISKGDGGFSLALPGAHAEPPLAGDSLSSLS